MTEFIYTGKTTYDGKTYFGFISVELHNSIVAQNIAVGADREMTRKTSWFPLKKAPCHSIGGVYTFPNSFTLNDDGMITGYAGLLLRAATAVSMIRHGNEETTE